MRANRLLLAIGLALVVVSLANARKVLYRYSTSFTSPAFLSNVFFRKAIYNSNSFFVSDWRNAGLKPSLFLQTDGDFQSILSDSIPVENLGSDKCRIVLFGRSQFEGAFNPPSSRIEPLLREKSGCYVHNISVGGQTLKTSFEKYFFYADQLRGSYIILMDSEPGAASPKLFRASSPFQFLKKSNFTFLLRLIGLSSNDSSPSTFTKIQTPNPSQPSVYQTYLLLFKELASLYSSEVIFATTPFSPNESSQSLPLGQFESEEHRRVVHSNSVALESCSTHNLRCLDLYGSMINSASGYFVDQLHFSSAGLDYVSDLITEILVDQRN